MHDPIESGVSAAEALRRLREGNERFRAGTSHLDRNHADMLAHLVRGQRPYATVLCCSDSRVPPEIVFDAGLGELFVVRVAGNVLSSEVAGSLQYAGAHLGTALFLVMGHDGCGAVHATVETMMHGTAQRSRIQALVANIRPGLSGLDLQRPATELLADAVEANVRWTVRQILETPEARANLRAGEKMLVGAVYELESGRVRFLE
jgi:carbonic anhydrase